LTLTQGTYYIKAESYDNSIELQWYGISLYIGDIPNIPPMVWIDYWPYDPGVGTVVWFYPYVYDPDGFIESWNWDFGDGTTNTDANYTSHVYTAPGDFTVLLTVVDNNGASASASTYVHVTVNLIPIAVLYSYPSLPDPYDTVYFDGSGSYDPDGWIQQYTWDFGDGDSYSTSSNYAYHWYYQGGMYLATLTVMDNRGATNSTSVWVHVNMPPVAVIVPSSETGKVGKPVTFDGSSSYDPEGEVLVYYSWYFSDGGNESGPVVTHTFAAVGQFTVVLQVEDATGAWGYEELAFSVLAPVPPIAVVAYSPANPVVGEQVIFDGSWSIDPDGSIVTYIWQFGDGSIALGAQVVHSYTAAKTYGVRLIVVDEDNLFDKTTSEITVASVPMAGFEFSPSQPISGQEVTFYAVGSYDPTGIVLYVWSFGDGTYAQGWQVMHTYATTGDKTVSLTVTNAMGVQATITKVVTVASSAMSTEIPTSTSALGAGPEDLAVPGIGLLMATLVSLMVGCVVLDVAGSVGHRRRGA
jgi:PKD repeat protein